MTRRFISSVAGPSERGRELGAVHAREVAATVASYRRVFAGVTGRVADLAVLGGEALDRIDGWAPELGVEIRGIAAGAGLPVTEVAAINARTEILAVLGHEGSDECSTVVALGGTDAGPVAMQNWDWYTELADNWLEWTIPHPDGRRVTTLTEYGVVGKIGVNDRGVGILFNMLNHRDDGKFVGVPVHVVARRVLDIARDVDEAVSICSSATASASTAITLVGGRSAGWDAVSVELWPGGHGVAQPFADGLLLRTNHFLTEPARFGDVAEERGSDTFVRYDALLGRLGGQGRNLTAEHVAAALSEHAGGVCCHPDPDDSSEFRYATLATVRLDPTAGQMETLTGPPCELGPRLAATRGVGPS